jgi:hypothetical protein
MNNPNSDFNPCENCDEMARLTHQDEAIERIRDAAQAATLADLRREYPRGHKDALMWVITVLDEKWENANPG